MDELQQKANYLLKHAEKFPEQHKSLPFVSELSPRRCEYA